MGAMNAILDVVTLRRWFGKDRYDDEYYEDEYYEDEYGHDDYEPAMASTAKKRDIPRNDGEGYENYGRVVKMHKNDVVIKYHFPKTLDDAADVCRMVKENKIVVVNLSEVNDEKTTQRIVDCMSGMIYALDGNISRASDKIFMATSRHANIEGDRDGQSGDDIAEFTFARYGR